MIEPTTYVKNFNDRVKVMNQTQARDLTMTAQDARNLHADIFSLLALNNALVAQLQVKVEEETVKVELDGGKF